MELSIVMRTYNRLEYTIRSIMSIDEKSGLNRDKYEIVCVDQGSTDGTKEWLNFCIKEKYYPIVPIFLDQNVGDGLGMQEGIDRAKGDFIAQHDNDVEIVTENYYKELMDIYKSLEKSEKVCAIGGQHKQGVDQNSAPWRFGEKRYPNFLNEIRKCVLVPIKDSRHFLYPISWVTAAFIFRKKFISIPFTKGMCNSWCGEWWDRGYDNFSCETLKFWHIDSGETGAHVEKQAKKFPSYNYTLIHYSKFIK